MLLIKTEHTYTKLSKIIDLLIQFKDSLNLSSDSNKELYRELDIVIQSFSRIKTRIRDNILNKDQDECLLDAIDKY